MHIAHLDAVFLQIFGQALRHLLGERRDEDAALVLRRTADLGEQIVDLPPGGAHFHDGIQQAGRADELFHHLPRLPQFVGRGRGGDAHHLPHARVEFVKRERPVVVRRPDAETVVDEVGFAGEVARVHRPDLREGHVALVDEQQEIARKIVQKRKGRLARASAVEVTGIVLHALAVADLAHHLDIVARPLIQPLRFQQFPFCLKGGDFSVQILLDGDQAVLQLFALHRIVAGGEHDGVL